jgi:hypothetical protein
MSLLWHKNFEMAPSFLENLCTPDIGDVRYYDYVVFTSFSRKIKMDEVMITSFQVNAHVRMELVISVFWIHHPEFILHQSFVIDTDSISEMLHNN